MVSTLLVVKVTVLNSTHKTITHAGLLHKSLQNWLVICSLVEALFAGGGGLVSIVEVLLAYPMENGNLQQSKYNILIDLFQTNYTSHCGCLSVCLWAGLCKALFTQFSYRWLAITSVMLRPLGGKHYMSALCMFIVCFNIWFI